MSQLPVDCLNEIFEYLENDETTLRSCLLVNHCWSTVSVRILWRKIRNYQTLIACLSNDSKKILREKGITITSTSPPTFDYVEFCKVISINQIETNIKTLIPIPPSKNLNDYKKIIITVIQEIFKLLINKIIFKKIDLTTHSFTFTNSHHFTILPGAVVCLKNLSELHCSSDIQSEFLDKLCQTCHKIQSLNIEFAITTSNRLANFISAQKNLNHLYITRWYGCEKLSNDVVASFKELPNTLQNLYMCNFYDIQLSFIEKFLQLRELTLSFEDLDDLEGFKELQYVSFSQLQVLKFMICCPRFEYLIKFLENNGNNLQEFYIGDDTYRIDDTLNVAIAKFCPRIRKLFVGFQEKEILITIFNNCQKLESLKVWCCGDYIDDKNIMEAVIKYSPKNFYDIKLCYSYDVRSELTPGDLESFFTGWINRDPLSLALIHNSLDSSAVEINKDNINIINKYIELGIVNEFKILGQYFD